MKYDCFKNDCYNLYTIKTNKFKSCHIEVVFQNKCDKESITYLALLFDMLTENNKEYPSRKLLARKMQELYNTNIYAVNTRVGGILLSNLVVDFLEPKYMDKDSLEEIIKLLFSFIFNPNVEVEEFDEITFGRVKMRLKKEIESLKENPKQASILDALSALDNSSPRSFNSSGDIEVLKDITPKKLYKFYKKVLEKSLVDIYIIGNLDMKEVNKLIHKYAKFTSIKTTKNTLYLDDIQLKKAINIQKPSNLSQTNLAQIYSYKPLDDFETNYVMPIFNMLWGSGSLDSKLYKSIRGENGLCYNITTFYQKYDKVLILHTSLDGQNTNKAVKLIKECLNQMQKGNITEEELDNVKNLLINSLNLIYDSPSRLIDNYLFANLAHLPDVEKRIEEFQKVTINDLVKLSKKISLLLTYRLGE